MRWPPEARQFILDQQQEIEQLRLQLTALATELASLRERIGRSSRNSSNPPSSDGPGFKPPERRKGSGRKRGGQPGHPGSGPEPLPIERVDEVVEHHPEACRRCGTLLEGDATKQKVSLYLKNLFEEGNLDPAATGKESLTVQIKGSREM
jgi:transposase